MYVFVNRWTKLKWKQLHKSPSNFFLLNLFESHTFNCYSHLVQSASAAEILWFHYRSCRIRRSLFRDGISLARFKEECWMHGSMRWKAIIIFYSSFAVAIRKERNAFFSSWNILGCFSWWMKQSRQERIESHTHRPEKCVEKTANDEYQNMERCTLYRRNGIALQERKNVFHSFNYLVSEIIFRMKFYWSML